MSILRKLAGSVARLFRRSAEAQVAADEPGAPATETPVASFLPPSDPSATRRRRRGVRIPGPSFSPGKGSCRSCQPPGGYGR
jgi:hypothetical protein